MRPMMRLLPRGGTASGSTSRWTTSGRAPWTPFFQSSSSPAFILRSRFQSTSAAAAAASPAAAQSLLTKLWTSPVGVKTVHFWAPVMKWALVLTGVSDFYRPADKLSLTQNVALTATGAIWTRWCFIIKPKNMLLAAVNFFLGCVGSVQVFRILSYQRSVKNQPGAAAEIQSVAKDAKSEIEGAVQDPKSVVDRVAK